MRIGDYRFYSNVSLAFGILLVAVGIILLLITSRVEIGVIDVSLLMYLFSPSIWQYRRYAKFSTPHLSVGIVLFIVSSIILMLVSRILLREYKIRSAESQENQTDKKEKGLTE